MARRNLFDGTRAPHPWGPRNTAWKLAVEVIPVFRIIGTLFPNSFSGTIMRTPWPHEQKPYDYNKPIRKKQNEDSNG